jgi:hypothetical protein
MKKTLLILLTLTNFICIGQTIKNYSGQYGDGKMNYQYYENKSFERIYHGPYIYTCTEKYVESLGKGNEITKGNFINNFQSGLCDYSFKNKYTKVTIQGHYKNGLMDGIWTKTMLDIIKKTTTQKMIVNYKDGKLIGDFYFAQKQDLIRGKFNDNSHFEGRWTVKYKDFFKNNIGEPHEIIYDFKDGLLIFVLSRNLTSGEILYKNDQINLNDFYNSSTFRNGISYLFEITDNLKKNRISNSYYYNYGSIKEGNDIFSFGLRDIDYNTLVRE